MLNFKSGTPIAYIIGGKYDEKVIYVTNDKPNDYQNNSYDEIEIDDGKIQPLVNVRAKKDKDDKVRSIFYIAGPAGSGKTTHAIKLIIPYISIFPEKPFFLFSRTNYKDDPAYKGLKPIQIYLDESLILNPIDITQELVGESIVLFDDCNTLQDDKLKKIIDKLMADIMEVGSKLDITIIIYKSSCYSK